jgi:hypothetical protein
MPVLAWTLHAIHNKTGKTALLRELVPPLVRYWDWWRTTRDIDGNGTMMCLLGFEQLLVLHCTSRSNSEVEFY